MSDFHPKSGETPNARRAAWAKAALDAFTRKTFNRSVNKLIAEADGDLDGGDIGDACSDLICNLLHFMAGRKMDYAGRVRRALDHFTVERAQEGRASAPELQDVLKSNPIALGPSLADFLKPYTIQDVIEAYALHHPDAVATAEQVKRAAALHANDDITIDAEAFCSPVVGFGYHVSGWLWVPSTLDEDEATNAKDGAP